MIKPAGPYGDIAFGRQPVRAGMIAGVETFSISAAFKSIAGAEFSGVQRLPARFTGNALFVAHPANIRTAVAEHARIRLEFADKLPSHRPVVAGLAINRARFPGAAIATITAVGAVEPDLADRAVMSQQLRELLTIIGKVGRLAVIRAVAVPGREMDPTLQTVFAPASEMAFTTSPLPLSREEYLTE
jgi:hypothetical protein